MSGLAASGLAAGGCVATGFVAHILCSGTFVSGLDPDRVFSDTTEAMPGVVQARHHGADGDARDGRDRLVGLAVQLAQRQHLAVHRRQTRDRALHDGARFGLAVQMLGRLLVDGGHRVGTAQSLDATKTARGRTTA